MKKKTGFVWIELIGGILMIALGIYTLLRPDGKLTGAVVIYGVFAVIMGICDIVIYAHISRFNGFGPMVSLISGILSVMCGFMLLANPSIGKWALTVLLPIWFIAHSISGLTHTPLMRMMGGPFYYVMSMTSDILGLVLGMLMLLSPAFSFITLHALGYVVAVYLILFGIEAVTAAFVRKNFDR